MIMSLDMKDCGALLNKSKFCSVEGPDHSCCIIITTGRQSQLMTPVPLPGAAVSDIVNLPGTEHRVPGGSVHSILTTRTSTIPAHLFFNAATYHQLIQIKNKVTL